MERLGGFKRTPPTLIYLLLRSMVVAPTTNASVAIIPITDLTVLYTVDTAATLQPGVPRSVTSLWESLSEVNTVVRGVMRGALA